MKKVLALVLAVMMLATVAFAYKRPVANVTPGSTLKITKNEVKDTGHEDDNQRPMRVYVTNENGEEIDQGTISNYILRSITNENYSITNVRYSKAGKNLVSGVSINDKEERVEVALKDDLDNQTSRDFEVSFKLKGKARFTLRDEDEVYLYNEACATSQKLKVGKGAAAKPPVKGDDDAAVKEELVGKKVTLPDLAFTFSGNVGYGKVEISIGSDTEEELENLNGKEDLFVGSKDEITSAGAIDFENDILKFKKGDAGTIGNATRVAGAYTADAILTEEYGDALTMEARVYHNDTLYLYCDNTPNKEIVGRLADSDADMDFYLFNTNTKYTTFNSNVKLYFNDAEEDDFVYQIRDGKLVKAGEFSEDDDCWIVKTRTLGQYVVSDVELTEFEAAAGTTDTNPDTGANDVVGIATALAAVALVSAAAVSLKK